MKAQQVVTPAVAKTIDADTMNAQADQAEARARRRGISSTYNRFAQANGGGNGTTDRLG